MKYYPALWYDIGPETAAARHALYGFRTELYAENFVGRIAAWCRKHGMGPQTHLFAFGSPSPCQATWTRRSRVIPSGHRAT